jgi:hypothetical protein
MEWIRENWVFLLFFIIFISMHLFGHGCGGHGKHREEDEEHKGHVESSGGKKEKKGGHGCC